MTDMTDEEYDALMVSVITAEGTLALGGNFSCNNGASCSIVRRNGTPGFLRAANHAWPISLLHVIIDYIPDI